MDRKRRHRLVFYTAALLALASAWILFISSVVLLDVPWVVAPVLLVQTGLSVFMALLQFPGPEDPAARSAELVFITTNLFAFFVTAMSALDAGRRHQLGATPAPGFLLLGCNVFVWAAGIFGFVAGQPVTITHEQMLEEHRAVQEQRKRRAEQRLADAETARLEKQARATERLAEAEAVGGHEPARPAGAGALTADGP